MSAMAAASLYADSPPRLPRWANTLLVAGLGVALAVLTIKLLPQPAAVTGAPAPDTTVVAKAAPNPAELGNAIAAGHLFGDAAKAPVKVEEKKVEAPIVETQLNLQLAGVFAYQPQERAIAIISAGSSEQIAYGVGDKISGETTLKAVYPDHVIINNRGKDEILRLPENVQPTAMRPIQDAGANDDDGFSQQGVAATENLDQPIELPTTPGALRDTLARNPSMLGRVVSAEPYQENGKLLGYRITPKQNPEILEAQGIIAGDVITRVNNIQLNSQKQGIRALRNAVKAENLEVTILRDGVEVPINISLAQ
ncbi:MAG: type II secretion system protein GspC [Gammaproteobacteria bacterium]